MEQELIRNEAIYLRNCLYNIRNSIYELENLYISLKNDLKEGLMIDGKSVEQDTVATMLTDVKQTNQDIRNHLLPLVNQKI